MVQITKPLFPFFFPFRSRPLIGGAGIAGKSATSRFGTFRESRESTQADGAHWHWIVEMPDRVIEAYFNPHADHAEVIRQYPTATDLEPIPEPPKPVLSPSGKWYFTPPAPTK